jgi:hypothetical protein
MIQRKGPLVKSPHLAGKIRMPNAAHVHTYLPEGILKDQIWSSLLIVNIIELGMWHITSGEQLLGDRSEVNGCFELPRGKKIVGLMQSAVRA